MARKASSSPPTVHVVRFPVRLPAWEADAARFDVASVLAELVGVAHSWTYVQGPSLVTHDARPSIARMRKPTSSFVAQRQGCSSSADEEILSHRAARGVTQTC